GRSRSATRSTGWSRSARSGTSAWGRSGGTYRRVPAPDPERLERLDGADGFGSVRLARDRGEQLAQLGAGERLLLQQRVGDAVEQGAVLREEPDRLGVGVVCQPALFGVAEALRLLRQRVVVGPHRP